MIGFLSLPFIHVVKILLGADVVFFFEKETLTKICWINGQSEYIRNDVTKNTSFSLKFGSGLF